MGDPAAHAIKAPQAHQQRELAGAEEFGGLAVFDVNTERLGNIRRIFISARRGYAQYALIDFAGFLPISGQIPVPWSSLSYDEQRNGYVLDVTDDQLHDAPRFLCRTASALSRAVQEHVSAVFASPHGLSFATESVSPPGKI